MGSPIDQTLIRILCAGSIAHGTQTIPVVSYPAPGPTGGFEGRINGYLLLDGFDLLGYRYDCRAFGSGDFEGMKRIQRGGDWTEAMLEEWDERMSQIDVLRAPIPPDRPDQAQIWPVYLKDASTGKFIDTHLFGYWNGRWYRCGNMGSPADWRRHEEKIREAFISNMKK